MMAVLCFVSTRASAQDWPRYRRDAARSSICEETIETPLHLVWLYDPDRPPSPAWPDPLVESHRMPFDHAPVPVIADGLLYFGSTTDDSVRALDAESGELRWMFTTGGPVRFAPDIAGARAYVASDDGYLYCLDARTGELVWRFHAARTPRMVPGNGRMISRRPMRSGVLVDQGVVYTTAGMWPSEGVIVYALDADTGAVIWQNDTTLGYYPQPHSGSALTGVAPQGYLAADGDMLLVPTGRAVPAAFNRTDGQLLYYRQAANQRNGGAWVTLDAEQDLFINTHRWGGYLVYRLSTGENLGRPSGEHRFVPEGRIQAGDLVLRGGRGIMAERNGDTVWSADVEGHVRRLALAGDRLYASTDDGRIYCFAPGEAPEGHDPHRVFARQPEEAPEYGPLAREVLEQLARRRISRGYALVLGEPEPGLTRALVESTELHVLQVLESEEHVQAERERLLDSTHLYGSRIAVTVLPESGALPLPPYFANIVVGGPDTLPGPSFRDIYRTVRPAGGLWLPAPGGAEHMSAIASQIEKDKLTLSETPREPLVELIERGKLPGAFDWDSEAPVDERLRWPLELLWFGGPGPERMVDRHSSGPPPIAAGGRYFHIGAHHIIAIDAYNGTELWSRSIPYAYGNPHRYFRTWRGEMFIALESLSADDESVYLSFGEAVPLERVDARSAFVWERGLEIAPRTEPPIFYRLDAQTGRQTGVFGEFRTPRRYRLDGPKRFEVDIESENATTSAAVTLTPEEGGLRIDLETRDEAVERFDSWELFFDFRPPYRRAEIYEPDDLDMFRVYVQAQNGRPRPFLQSGYDTAPADNPSERPHIEFSGGEVDGGTAVSLFLPWAGIPAAAEGMPQEFAFTATQESFGPGFINGWRLPALRTHLFGGDNTAGTFNNGWPVFVLGDESENERQIPKVRSLDELPEHAHGWGRRPSQPDEDKSYVGQSLAAFTGDTREISDTQRYARRYYQKLKGCGPTVYSSQMDFFRSSTLGYYDAGDDSGVRNFGGMRTGCATAPVPALGLLISSESSSGCGCSYNFQTSLALAPADKPRNEDWAIYYENIRFGTFVSRTALNIGAPGDRRDDQRRLWIGTPRTMPSWSLQRVMGLPVSLECDERFGPHRINTDNTLISGTDIPWVYGSQIRGIRRLAIDLQYYNPLDGAAMSRPAGESPIPDGMLIEPVWDGSRRITLPERTSVQLRHDDENLYVAFERPAYIDRLGNKTPWRRATEDAAERALQEEDLFELRFGARRAARGDLVRFAVTASKARHNSHWEPAVDIPRQDGGLMPDEVGGEGSSEGFRARIAPALESRFAWDEQGLRLLLVFDPDPGDGDHMPVRNIAFIAARQGSEAADNHLRLEVNLQDRSWTPVLRREGQETEGGLQVREGRSDGAYMIEAFFPREQLGIEFEAGAEIALPIWYHLPGEQDITPEKIAEDRRRFLQDTQQWRTVSRLRLAGHASAPTRMLFPTGERHARSAYFETAENFDWTGRWAGGVQVTDDLFTAELAIPWSDIERFGLERNDLRVDFGAAPPINGGHRSRLGFDAAARAFQFDDSDAKSGRYTVRLHFAELDPDVGPQQRVFDVLIQGETVLEGLDVAAEAGGTRRALMCEFRGVEAERAIEITFRPQTRDVTESSAPILSGFEIEEEPQPAREKITLIPENAGAGSENGDNERTQSLTEDLESSSDREQQALARRRAVLKLSARRVEDMLSDATAHLEAGEPERARILLLKAAYEPAYQKDARWQKKAVEISRLIEHRSME